MINIYTYKYGLIYNIKYKTFKHQSNNFLFDNDRDFKKTGCLNNKYLFITHDYKIGCVVQSWKLSSTHKRNMAKKSFPRTCQKCLFSVRYNLGHNQWTFYNFSVISYHKQNGSKLLYIYNS